MIVRRPIGRDAGVPQRDIGFSRPVPPPFRPSLGPRASIDPGFTPRPGFTPPQGWSKPPQVTSGDTFNQGPLISRRSIDMSSVPAPVISAAKNLVNQGMAPNLALVSSIKAFQAHPGFNPDEVKTLQGPRPTMADITGVKDAVTNPPKVDPKNPYVPPGGTNPYTGKPLAPNEYVGVAGSEIDHPGLVRIPPPGWDNPDSPFYERRDYYIGPDGKIVANEAGFSADKDHPYDSGRPGERNSEFAGRGYQHVAMSQPGVTQWGPGGTAPKANPYARPSSMQGLPDWLQKWFAGMQA